MVVGFVMKHSRLGLRRSDQAVDGIATVLIHADPYIKSVPEICGPPLFWRCSMGRFKHILQYKRGSELKDITSKTA